MEDEMSLRERLSHADEGHNGSSGPPGLAAAAYQDLKIDGRIHQSFENG